MQLLLTSEHATNRVPASYKNLFVNARKVLDSHRGWDPGSLSIGKTMQRLVAAPLFQTRATRLLVDPNRSIGHPRLYSEYTRDLDDATKSMILSKYYFPHRIRVETWIENMIRSGQGVIHISLHTFAAELNGEIRNADVGLLYDPARQTETVFCREWQQRLAESRPDIRVRRNYPYRGRADGFTTYLRKCFSVKRYIGIELEVNQRHADRPRDWKHLAAGLAKCLSRAASNG